MANHKIKERKEAIKNGQLTYLTGKPCKRGHFAPRLVSTQCCQQCRIEVHQPTDRNNYRYGDTFRRQFHTRRNDALRTNIPFTIKLDEIERPEFCPVFGTKLNYGWSGEGRRDRNKASIDKIIPELGYVKGNVAVISWRANMLKGNMTIDELKKLLRYMEKNNE